MPALSQAAAWCEEGTAGLWHNPGTRTRPQMETRKQPHCGVGGALRIVRVLCACHRFPGSQRERARPPRGRAGKKEEKQPQAGLAGSGISGSAAVRRPLSLLCGQDGNGSRGGQPSAGAKSRGRKLVFRGPPARARVARPAATRAIPPGIAEEGGSILFKFPDQKGQERSGVSRRERVGALQIGRHQSPARKA